MDSRLQTEAQSEESRKERNSWVAKEKERYSWVAKEDVGIRRATGEEVKRIERAARIAAANKKRKEEEERNN